MKSNGIASIRLERKRKRKGSIGTDLLQHWRERIGGAEAKT